jgi:hypothetical protein
MARMVVSRIVTSDGRLPAAVAMEARCCECGDAFNPSGGHDADGGDYIGEHEGEHYYRHPGCGGHRCARRELAITVRSVPRGLPGDQQRPGREAARAPLRREGHWAWTRTTVPLTAQRSNSASSRT